MKKHIKNLNELTRAMQKDITGNFRTPCKNDFIEYNNMDIAVDINGVRANDFESLLIDLKITFDIGIENYTGGVVAHEKLTNILKSTKNANKTAQLFNLFCWLVYRENSQYYINKFYKNLSKVEQAKLNNVLEHYLISEYNNFVDNFNYEVEVEKC